MDLSELRLSYTSAGLIETEIDPDPFRQFELWMNQALSLQSIEEPNAMTLATVGPEGEPSVRTVLLKAFDPRGFVFYTNYESRKAKDIALNPAVALLFYWPVLHRQIRIAGTASQTSAAESDDYFNSRPTGHQLGAWASHQSSAIAGREVLEESLAAAAKRFDPGPIPRPPFWGGIRVSPRTFEFWQGRQNRLHDRIEYTQTEPGWTLRRLSP